MRNPIESNILNGDIILKLADHFGIEVRSKSERIKVKKSDLNRMEKVGNKIYKFGHKVWELKKEGDEFFLCRLKDEE